MNWLWTGLRAMRRIRQHRLASRMGPPKGSYDPRRPAPGMRRVYYDKPSTIAECGGPCTFGGPELCDCGALWRDVPITPGHSRKPSMTTEHPITPPPQLVQQWYTEADNQLAPYYVYIATQAARWGFKQRIELDAAELEVKLQKARDEELEACCEWVSQFSYDDYSYQDELRATRRPKPPSLAEPALEVLDEMNKPLGVVTSRRCDTIRAALKRLQELENNG